MQMLIRRQARNSPTTYSGTSVNSQLCSVYGRLTRYKCHNILVTGYSQIQAHESPTEYFRVFFFCLLRIRVFSYIRTVPILKSGNLTLIQTYYLILSPYTNCVIVSVMWLFCLRPGSTPGSHTAFSYQHIASFNLEQFLSHFLPFLTLTF